MDSIVTAVDIRRRYGEGDASVNALGVDPEGNRFELWEPAEGM